MATKESMEHLASTIERCFKSPNVSDSNWEIANLVDTTDRLASCTLAIAKALKLSDVEAGKYTGPRTLGDATFEIATSLEHISQSIDHVASSIDELAAAIYSLAKDKTPAP
jgi:methyl-accepting chemotaxis protein